ncbi:uncharacterized protein LOC119768990 [Culex quinquefasciatus]|uniref:uncharacterized protein LOC119768990 n=1 Tax=Culex quinquefasciatus TaxID=7176 RepID=UPI0018E2D582|nr:uncharacterized protein LOC119768990 [Culex quinquefasciatus]
MSTENLTEAPAASAAVAVKLPDFWKSDPAMWFAQAESQFVLAGVNKDETKFHHIVAKIDQTVICHVADLVRKPPATGKYNAIKERLIARFELTDAGACFRTQGRRLAAENAVLQRLPANIRGVLSINDGSLSKLAEMGDKMTELVPQTSAVKTLAVPDSQESLADQVAALTAELQRMKAQGPDRRRPRSVSRKRDDESTICWYHRKYGSQADRCRSPCKFHQSKLTSRPSAIDEVGGSEPAAVYRSSTKLRAFGFSSTQARMCR